MFPEIRKKLGFGMMRLPTGDDGVDFEALKPLVDHFIAHGFNYFDTAKGYHNGQSETAVKLCVAQRYPREKFLLTDKLSHNFFKTEADIRPLFERQLADCGVEYFDFYLCHAITRGIWQQYVDCRALDILRELKAEGKIRHIGLSFHDMPEFLEEILAAHSEIEAVQLQINYVDYDDAGVRGRGNLEVAKKYGKPVMVMEPVKGGVLTRLPDEARAVFDRLGGSTASYAIRYAASFPEVACVLSGMGTMEMVRDNVSYMEDFKPLDRTERAAVERVREILKARDDIPCTACRYCTLVCPRDIPIPDLFNDYNLKKAYDGWNSSFYYGVHTRDHGKASDCLLCGACERECPQHIPIRDHLKEVAKQFEGGK